MCCLWLRLLMLKVVCRLSRDIAVMSCAMKVSRCGLRLWFKPSCFASALVAVGVLCDVVCGRGLSWDLCMWCI